MKKIWKALGSWQAAIIVLVISSAFYGASIKGGSNWSAVFWGIIVTLDIWNLSKMLDGKDK